MNQNNLMEKITEEQSDQLRSICYRASDRESQQGLQALGEQERLVFLVWGYIGEVLNGGHMQFFYNSAGRYTQETIDALRSLDLTEPATLLERGSMLLFGSTSPPFDIEERNDEMADAPEDYTGQLDAQFHDLDRKLFSFAPYGELVYVRLWSVTQGAVN
jgi:Domain of unknown function (DUF4375)